MAHARVSRDWRDWVGLAARLVLGLGLVVAGGLKVGRLEANVQQVALYQLPLPGWAETVVGYAQPFVEITVGLLLVVGLFTRVSAALGTIAMGVFIAGIVWAWSQGLRIDCGCFSLGGELGPDDRTRYTYDILRDLGFMACGVWLWARPAAVLAVDNWLLAPVDLPGSGSDDDLPDDPPDDFPEVSAPTTAKG
ncbi:hypothetical protein GCM10009785_20290 [Brooklawnia cerclae]